MNPVDPWQIIASLAAIIAAVTAAYAKLANDRMSAADKREERWDKRDSALMAVITNNTSAMQRMCDASDQRGKEHTVQVAALDHIVEAFRTGLAAHDEQAKGIWVDVKEVKEGVNRIRETQDEQTVVVDRIEGKVDQVGVVVGKVHEAMSRKRGGL